MVSFISGSLNGGLVNIFGIILITKFTSRNVKLVCVASAVKLSKSCFKHWDYKGFSSGLEDLLLVPMARPLKEYYFISENPLLYQLWISISTFLQRLAPNLLRSQQICSNPEDLD